MVPMYTFSAMRSCLGRTARLFLTLLASFSLLPAIAHGPDTGATLKSDAFRMARAAADCQRSFEELKEKF
ncbi:hypothetical protein [Tunturiibacter lichenicola]|jgi:hypothetical protein|uniref:hypothetical protein n=1 Tax=Tunturiibacter lichenicola TaxID=2051959 RepID=UPI0021B41F1B|nr:hypothetical protein [Edaphobacter lichenicola]